MALRRPGVVGKKVIRAMPRIALQPILDRAADEKQVNNASHYGTMTCDVTQIDFRHPGRVLTRGGNLALKTVGKRAELACRLDWRGGESPLLGLRGLTAQFCAGREGVVDVDEGADGVCGPDEFMSVITRMTSTTNERTRKAAIK